MQKIENLEMLLNELGEELATTTSPREVVREVKFRDVDLVVELNESTSRARTGTKINEQDRKSALAEIEKSLSEWYDKNGHEVLLLNR